MISVENSDIGVRRSDIDQVDGLEQFAMVADAGVMAGFLRLQTDWRTPAELRLYAARIHEAADWLEAQ